LKQRYLNLHVLHFTINEKLKLGLPHFKLLLSPF